MFPTAHHPSHPRWWNQEKEVQVAGKFWHLLFCCFTYVCAHYEHPPCHLGKSLRCLFAINLTNPCLLLCYYDTSALIRSSKDTILPSPENSRCIIFWGLLSTLGVSFGNEMGTALCWEEKKCAKISYRLSSMGHPIADIDAGIKRGMHWLSWCFSNIPWSSKAPRSSIPGKYHI